MSNVFVEQPGVETSVLRLAVSQRGWSLMGAALVVALALGGCNPPNVVPVAPPGLEYQPVVHDHEHDEKDAAEALGETRTALGSQPQTAGAGDRREGAGPPLATPTPIGEARKLPSGLQYETLKEGTGDTAVWGKTVAVHYTGTLANGEVFDSSRPRNEPFRLLLGSGQVIRGWDEGLNGMKVGEVRKLIIPPELAYGSNQNGKIPPNSTLTFEVELMESR